MQTGWVGRAELEQHPAGVDTHSAGVDICPVGVDRHLAGEGR